MKTIFLAAAVSALFSTGCATTSVSGPPGESGPQGTIAYYVPVDSSEPGTRIEVNGESVGSTPMTLRIFGDRDGTFHNFGSYDFIVRAFPPGAGRPPKTKVYRTGALLAGEDKIPDRIYFIFGPDALTPTPR
jgi:hypothetical protein